ncbi:hypothetical protein ONZ51_g8934 [Trametes cubensis]|uniref:F-box domain-containing protein n=1 Tax=Trametes cubensis TaxID=1111947 RepID=A0AAD7X8T3_9APHY|nr:hypothetical protein ONZ51_g8934 [Trametes cubensis]
MDASPITPDADTSYLDHIPLDHLAIALSRQATQKCQNMTLPELQWLDRILSSASSAARTAMNTQNSRRRLPPEVLSMIIDHVLADAPTSAAPEETARIWNGIYHRPSRIIGTHSLLCKEWRRTLVTYARPWTLIRDCHPEAVKICLERSQQLPLTIHIDRNTSPPPLLNQLPALGSRLRELHWIAKYQPIHGSHSKLSYLTFPAPKLEVLRIQWEFHEEELLDDAGPLRTMFSGQTPRLRALHLSMVPWLPANHFPSLTHLCLTDINGPLIPFNDFVHLIRQCPQLQHLALTETDFLDSTDEDYVVPDDADELLGSLRRLSFDKMPITTVNHILLCLKPPRIDVAIQALRIPLDISPNPMDTVSVTSFIPEICSTLTQLAILRSSWHSDVTITAMGSNAALRLSTMSVDFDHPFWDPDRPVEWAKVQLDALPLTQIETFYISFMAFRSSRPFPYVTDLPKVVERMTNLKQLIIFTNDLSLFLGDFFSLKRTQHPQHRLSELHVIVKPLDPAFGLSGPVDGFRVEDPSALPAIDNIIIHWHCPQGIETTLEYTMDKLYRYYPSIEVRRDTHVEFGLTFPEVCHDPVAYPEWIGSQWDIQF